MCNEKKSCTMKGVQKEDFLQCKACKILNHLYGVGMQRRMGWTMQGVQEKKVCIAQGCKKKKNCTMQGVAQKPYTKNNFARFMSPKNAFLHGLNNARNIFLHSLHHVIVFFLCSLYRAICSILYCL